MRRNLKPWPSGAGLMVSETFCPVCKDVPSKDAADASVCSSSVAMRASVLGEKSRPAKLVFSRLIERIDGLILSRSVNLPKSFEPKSKSTQRGLFAQLFNHCNLFR